MLSNLEIKRKTVHLFAGLFLALFYYFDWLKWQFMLFVILVAFILSYYSRNHYVPVIEWFLERLDRKEDRKDFPARGAITLLVGVFLAMVLFPKDAGIASIMVLAFGDSVSAILGPFGTIPHPWNKIKLVEGMLAGTIAGFIGAAIFIPYWEAFWASFIAMALEILDLEFYKTRIDDNLMIPVVAGIVITLIRAV